MSNQALLNFSENVAKRSWTDEEIRSFTFAERKSLVAYKPGVSEPPPKIKALLARKEGAWTKADAMFAATVNQSGSLDLSRRTFEEAAVSQGGSVEATDKTITFYALTGERYSVVNTPIPQEPKEVDNYENLDNVSSLCASVVHVHGGKWECKNEAVWNPVFPGVSTAGIIHLASAVKSLLNDCEDWKAMKETGKSSTTGIVALRFVRRQLNKLDKWSYDYINTIICVDVLRVMYKDEDGAWCLSLDDDEKSLIPQKVWTQRSKTPEHKKIMKKFPCVFTYNGGWVPPARVPLPVDPSLGDVIVAHQKVREFENGGDSAPALLASMKDYTGMITDNFKRIYFIVSAVLGVWSLGKVVDVRLTNDGDLNTLWVLLNYWCEKIKSELDAEVPNSMFLAMKDVNSEWFKFLPASRDSVGNPSITIKKSLINNHREGAVAVGVSKARLHTKAEKDEIVDHEDHAFTVLPVDLPSSYVLKCPVYGSAFFLRDPAVQKVLAKKTVLKEDIQRYQKVIVQAFGSARDFQGVVTTLENFSLVGQQVEKIVPASVKTDGSSDTPSVVARTIVKRRFVKVPLTVVPTLKEWYFAVLRSLGNVYSAPWKPVSRFSPITNLLLVSKGKVSLVNSDLGGEGSGFQGQVFPKSTKSRQVLFTKDDLDDEGESDSSEEAEVIPEVVAPSDKKKKVKMVFSDQDDNPLLFEDKHDDDEVPQELLMDLNKDD